MTILTCYLIVVNIQGMKTNASHQLSTKEVLCMLVERTWRGILTRALRGVFLCLTTFIPFHKSFASSIAISYYQQSRKIVFVSSYSYEQQSLILYQVNTSGHQDSKHEQSRYDAVDTNHRDTGNVRDAEVVQIY